jgi:hypothetical protein
MRTVNPKNALYTMTAIGTAFGFFASKPPTPPKGNAPIVFFQSLYAIKEQVEELKSAPQPTLDF